MPVLPDELAANHADEKAAGPGHSGRGFGVVVNHEVFDEDTSLDSGGQLIQGKPRRNVGSSPCRVGVFENS